MGKPTGFLEYEREDAPAYSPKERIKNFNEFSLDHYHLKNKDTKVQDVWIMEFHFQSRSKMLAGMASGCPLNNLIPEWNDLLYHGNMEQAYNRFTQDKQFP